jgi:hypothetical protein
MRSESKRRATKGYTLPQLRRIYAFCDVWFRGFSDCFVSFSPSFPVANVARSFIPWLSRNYLRYEGLPLRRPDRVGSSRREPAAAYDHLSCISKPRLHYVATALAIGFAEMTHEARFMRTSNTARTTEGRLLNSWVVLPLPG